MTFSRLWNISKRQSPWSLEEQKSGSDWIWRVLRINIVNIDFSARYEHVHAKHWWFHAWLLCCAEPHRKYAVGSPKTWQLCSNMPVLKRSVTFFTVQTWLRLMCWHIFKDISLAGRIRYLCSRRTIMKEERTIGPML